MVNNTTQYLVEYQQQFRNGEHFGVYSSSQTKHLWPAKMVNFLEARLQWRMPERTLRFDTNDLNANNTDSSGAALGISCKLTEPVNYG